MEYPLVSDTTKITHYSDKKRLEELVVRTNTADLILYHGAIPHDKVHEVLSSAGALVLPRTNNKQNYYGFSTKMGEYLSSGVPVITTKWGEVANWLRDGDSAYIVEPEDTEALADAIVKVFTNPEQAERIGMEGRELSRKSFDYRSWSRPLVEFMYNLGK